MHAAVTAEKNLYCTFCFPLSFQPATISAIPKFFSFSLFHPVQSCCRAHSQSGSTNKTAGCFLDFLWHRRPRSRRTKEGKPCQVSPPQAGLFLPTRCSPGLSFGLPLTWQRSQEGLAQLQHVCHTARTPPFLHPPLHTSFPPYHPFAVDLRLTHPPLTESANLPPTPIKKNPYLRCVNQLPTKNARAIFNANFFCWMGSNLTVCLFDSEHATTGTLYLFYNTVSLGVCVGAKVGLNKHQVLAPSLARKKGQTVANCQFFVLLFLFIDTQDTHWQINWDSVKSVEKDKQMCKACLKKSYKK